MNQKIALLLEERFSDMKKVQQLLHPIFNKIRREDKVRRMTFPHKNEISKNQSLKYVITLNTLMQQKITVEVTFLDVPKENAQRFLRFQNAFNEIVFINRNFPLDRESIEKLFYEIVDSRFRGFSLEDQVFTLVQGIITKRKSNDLLYSIRRGTDEEDMMGKDFIIKIRLGKDNFFEFGFDVKSPGTFHSNENKHKREELGRNQLMTKKNWLDQNPKFFLGQIKKMAWTIYHQKMQQNA